MTDINQECTTPPSEHSSDSTDLKLFVTAATAAALAYVVYRIRNRIQSSKRLVRRPTSQTPTPAFLCALARAYRAIDPDPLTNQQLDDQLSFAISSQADPQYISNFVKLLDPSSRLKFGTAGVRSDIGFGYSRLNGVTVSAVVNAVAHVAKLSSTKSVVIGHDARHQSRKFAVIIADICHHLGAKVYLFSKHVPTPFVAFAVRYFHTNLGFCVTASHNPPLQNGIKVFWDDGIQIRPDIANKIEQAMKENRSTKMDRNVLLSDQWLSKDVIDPLDKIMEEYYKTTTELLKSRDEAKNSACNPIVYTACHGIGYEYIKAMFSSFGLPPVIPCLEQCDPDPDFPTLPFPNPEEKGALDLAIKLAKEKGVKVVIANDPDADRLGAAEIDSHHKARIFTGDEIALLFTDHLTNVFNEEDMGKYAVVASAVSSKIINALAKKRGFKFYESLTGFKWLNKVALDLTKSGKTVLLTYEEAIGFNVTQNIVCDKDGVSAAAVFAEMTATLYESGNTLANRIDELLLECGEHISSNGYLRLSDDSPSTGHIFDEARNRGFPTCLGKAYVKSIRDLSRGTDSGEDNGRATLPADTSSQFITFRCVRNKNDDDPSLVIHLRGSGTEPKIKYYSELRCTREEAKDGSGKRFLMEAVEDVIERVLQPNENKLVKR